MKKYVKTAKVELNETLRKLRVRTNSVGSGTWPGTTLDNNDRLLLEMGARIEELETQNRELQRICRLYEQSEDQYPDLYEAAPGDTRVLQERKRVANRRETEHALRESQKALRESRNDLQKLAGRLISTQEDELKRLSRELHDHLTQSLAVLAIETGKLEQKLQDAPDEILFKITEMKEKLIEVSEDVHGIARRLHPSILDDLGLVRAVKSECKNFSERYGIVTRFIPRRVPDRLPDEVALCLYRVVQEALRNIALHAQAGEVLISLTGTDDMLYLSVNDDGLGFDPKTVRRKAGLGLGSMRERVRLIDGSFSVRSKPGCGTTVEVMAHINGSDA
jgi:signal transduction histidine kinase